MSLNDVLKDLYLVDQQVRGLESRLDGARRHVRVQQIKLDQLQRQLEDLNAQLKQIQAACAIAENEVAATEEKTERLRQQMNNAKTNREYSTFLVEINTFKADKSKLEEQALEHMTRAETISGEIEKINQQITEQSKVKDLADQELTNRQDEVGQQLEQLKAKRSQAAEKIPDEALSVFERLCENNDGEAMSPVIEADRRRMEYTCGGCYMQIPVERVNLLATQNELVFCPSCKRILYLETELKETMQSS